ncbi:MAG: IS630 family transposase, partial [Cyanobacteria bacterium J06636_16]
EQLEQALASTEGFRSYKEVQDWLQTVCGVHVPYKTVHKTVRYRLKTSLKETCSTSEKSECQVEEPES